MKSIYIPENKLSIIRCGYNLYENYNIEYDSENVDISSFEKPQNDYSLRKLQHDVDLLFSKLKKIRINGLKKRGEMSIGNIIYKICRRTNYLQKLIDLKNYIYDKINSL